MAVLGQGNGASYPASIDTAEQQTDGASGTLADANWANDVTSAITAIEGELGVDPAGSMTTVAARLTTLIAAAGGIAAGTTANRPVAASGTYRLYWNTTLNRLELIKDDASVTGIVGVTDHGSLTGLADDDHTIYSLVTGSRAYTGDVQVNKASPAVRLTGTETSAKDVRWYEDAGSLYLQEYTGGSWVTRITIAIGTGEVTVAAEDVNAYDATNAVAVSLVAHGSRHEVGGQDALNYFQATYTHAIDNSTDTTETPFCILSSFLPSGTKTVNVATNMYVTVHGGDIEYFKIRQLGSTAATLTLNTNSSATATIVTGTFTVTASGAVDFELSQWIGNAGDVGHIRSIYIWTT